MTRRLAIRWRAARRCRACRGDDRGFTLIESVIALGLLFTVVLGLLTALTAGVKGVVGGRQRTVATSIANEVMEQARARSYGEVGNSLTDTTLATDPALVATGTTYMYNGETLAGSSLPGTNPPFNPHVWTRSDNGTTYTVKVYVTSVNPGSGAPYKRVTTAVSWSNAQQRGAVKPVRLSSLLYNVDQPPDPLLKGSADADAGGVTLGGAAIGPDVDSAQRWFAYTHGEIDSEFIKRAKGFGLTPHAQVLMKNGSVKVDSGNCTASGLSGVCPGAKAETIADNDAGTAPPENDTAGPTTDGSSELETSTIHIVSGGGSAASQSSARSCYTCFATQIGDNDGLPYQWSIAGGPNGFSTPLASGSITGTLLRSGSSCASADRCSQSIVDVNKDGSGRQTVTSSASASAPAIDMVSLDSSLVSLGMVRVGATNVSATASAGPGAGAPTISGGPVTIQMFNTVLASATDTVGYRSLTVTPGVASSMSTHADLTIGTSAVSIDATVRAFAGGTSSQTDATGAITHAEARLVSWLQVDVHLVIGSSIDMTVHFDYGRISAIADYAPAST